MLGLYRCKVDREINFKKPLRIICSFLANFHYIVFVSSSQNFSMLEYFGVSADFVVLSIAILEAIAPYP